MVVRGKGEWYIRGGFAYARHFSETGEGKTASGGL
jgi:hypothetical protein